MRKLRVDSNFFSAFLFSSSFSNVLEIRRNNYNLWRHHFRIKQNFVKSKELNFNKNFSNVRKMDDDSNYSDIFANEENSVRRASTFEDVQQALSLLKEIIEYQKSNVSSWIVESKVKKLCSFYRSLLKTHKNEFIQVLAKDYAVNHKQVFLSAQSLAKCNELSENEVKNDAKIIKNEDQLRNLLTPQYSWLFLHIGKLERGVKFLVDLRTDVLDLIAEKNAEGESTVEKQQLNVTLRELLSLWFSIGFLHLERVTWNSSCEMLQKISEYEAVHPVRSWTDLKRRVGPYRRCFVFLHGSMPGEPIVVLHTALCDEISSSMKGIVSARSRMSVDASAQKETLLDLQEEDPRCIKAAVFYSITSTQKGLQGIELGNYLIKSVVRELQNEFPQMTQFSSLSPIPNFKSWLIEKLKSAEKGSNDCLLPDELSNLKNHIKSSEFWRDLRRLLLSNSWVDDRDLVALLEKPLMRLCARYLYSEKRRGYALDSVGELYRLPLMFRNYKFSVTPCLLWLLRRLRKSERFTWLDEDIPDVSPFTTANFHLRNGAVMWRLNWEADLSPRGLSNSCSIMVNYRYFLDDTEFNSRTYLEKQIISASEQILKLADQAQQLIIVSKM